MEKLKSKAARDKAPALPARGLRAFRFVAVLRSVLRSFLCVFVLCIVLRSFCPSFRQSFVPSSFAGFLTP